MSSWSKNLIPNFRQLINKQRSAIEVFRSSSADASDPQLISVQNNLATLLLQEESYWKQQSKVFLAL
jgi:hypothetical protein